MLIIQKEKHCRCCLEKLSEVFVFVRIVDIVTFSTNHLLNSKMHKYSLNTFMSRQGADTNVTQKHFNFCIDDNYS